MVNEWQWHICMPSNVVRHYPTFICNNCRGELDGSINFNPKQEERERYELSQHMSIIDNILKNKKINFKYNKIRIFLLSTFI